MSDANKKKKTCKKQTLEAIKRHSFCGKRYNITWEKPPKWPDGKGNKFQPTGLCDSPDSLDPTIVIDPQLTEEELLKTAIDEAIHACIWPLDNDFVDEMSESIGSLLWRMGFRLQKP